MTGDWTALLADAGPWLAGAAGLATLVALGAARRASRAARDLRATAEMLDRGQHRLSGGLAALAEAQVAAQARLAEGVERRLGEVGGRLEDRGAETQARLGALGARISALDAAQARIEALSGEMLTLQQILSDKQARGAFGEVRLADLLRDAVPEAHLRFQAVLSNGRRADCLLLLPDPPGPIAIDAKFPLEGYRALISATGEAEKRSAERAFRKALTTHIRDISERYILPGETADGAVMFLPSEAVFAELHARFGDLVEAAHRARVWITSPTTLMAVLTTLRGLLRDARLQSGAAGLRTELAALAGEADRLAARSAALETHLTQAGADAEAIRRAAERAARRARRIEAAEFDEAPASAAE